MWVKTHCCTRKHRFLGHSTHLHCVAFPFDFTNLQISEAGGVESSLQILRCTRFFFIMKVIYLPHVNDVYPRTCRKFYF